MDWWVARGWVDKKRGGELGEWRKSRRGRSGGEKGGGSSAVGFLVNQTNRLVVGSNVPSMAVDALQ